jgi:hypothetical protein
MERKHSLIGTIVLGGEGGAELDAGLEEGAGFRRWTRTRSRTRRAGAVAVAEHAVVLATQPGHLRACR